MIEIKNLTQVFDKKKVIDSINLSIKKGDIFGLLGPNGAGKTTLISIMTTLLIPTKGEIIIDHNNLKTSSSKIRNKINVVFQDFLLDEELSVYDNLNFYARIYHIKKDKRYNVILDALKLVGLEEEVNKKTLKLSGGMKKRLEIARAILNQPKIIFFDEPMQGLDPIARKKLREYIIKINKINKTTIIFTSHDLEEVEKICDKIAIINKGKIIKTGTISDLKESLKKNSTLEEVFINFTK